MAKHVYVVFTNPKPGKDAAFSDWYENRHIPDVLKIPGFVGARRFTLSEVQRYPNQPWRYVTFYEIETDDLQSVADELTRRLGTPQMPGTDTIDPVLETHFFDFTSAFGRSTP